MDVYSQESQTVLADDTLSRIRLYGILQWLKRPDVARELPKTLRGLAHQLHAHIARSTESSSNLQLAHDWQL